MSTLHDNTALGIAAMWPAALMPPCSSHTLTAVVGTVYDISSDDLDALLGGGHLLVRSGLICFVPVDAVFSVLNESEVLSLH